MLIIIYISVNDNFGIADTVMHQYTSTRINADKRLRELAEVEGNKKWTKLRLLRRGASSQPRKGVMTSGEARVSQ